MSPFYTTLFILCPFDIASCLLELCEEAGWLHAVTGTSSQSLVYWWVTLLLCACKHIARVPAPLPSELLGSRGEKCAWSINYRHNLGSKTSCLMVEHNNQWHSGVSASESVQVHPVICWAARGSDVRCTQLLLEGREIQQDISTQAGSLFVKDWVVFTSGLDPPLFPAGHPQFTLGQGYHPQVRECTAFGKAQCHHSQAGSEEHSQAVRKKNSHTALALQALL